MKEQTEFRKEEVENRGSGNENEEKKEEFLILSHSLYLKRKRETDSLPCLNSTPNDFESRRYDVRARGSQSSRAADPDVFDVIEKEKGRQYKGIELIASENFVCRAVMEALGSHLTNKYSEGMPGARYYGGSKYIDEIETLCCKRALTAFGLDSENWGVNVQPYSCTSANFAVCVGILLRSDRIMGLDTPCGGKTSHGYYLPNGRKVSGASIFFGSLPYKVDPQTGYINIEKLQERALEFRPKILICGGSSYPREWDCAKFRKIADMSGAVLLCDMAQISGLIATKECESPLHLCNIVTSTTHKSLRGPRGGIIFYRKGSKPRKRGILLNQGRNFKKVCESCHNTVNKVTVSSKAGTITGVGVRIGTPAMTSRGCLGADMAIIADFLLGAAQIARDVQREHGNRKSFLNGLENNKGIVELRSRVKSFASQYALPGCEI